MGKKVALITGIRGQDGAYLAKLLLEKGYRVIGADRRSADANYWRLHKLGIHKEVEIEYMDLMDEGSVFRLIRKLRPDEVYNLAAQSFVGVSFEHPVLTAQVNALGVLRILEAIRIFSPSTKFYQASTSEMFGDSPPPQNENTPFRPCSPYAAAKVFAHNIAVIYRQAFGLFVCCGILFNHESPLRGAEFVTKKIARAAAAIKLGLQDRLVLGNLDARRDWGYAPEYVRAMWLMMQHQQPDDYVIATGKAYTVREFVEMAFAEVGIRVIWRGKGLRERGVDAATGRVVVEVSPKFFRPKQVNYLCGDYSKAKRVLGWQPATALPELVRIMVRAELEELSKIAKSPEL